MTEALQKLSRLNNYSKWIYSNFSQYVGGRVLEVGAGIGNIVDFYQSKCKEIVATDLFDTKIEIMKERFNHLPHIKSMTINIFDNHLQSDTIKNGSFDTVICINVLEHIEDDKAAMMKMLDLLRDNGKLIIYVPALSFLYCEMDSSIGHYRRYNKGRLSKFAAEMNMKILKNHYANFLGVLPYFIKGKVLKKTTAYSETISDKNVILYNNIFSVCEKMESWIHPPIGTSEVIVLEKTR